MLWSDRQAPAEQAAECAEIAATAAAAPVAMARAVGCAPCELHFWVRYSLSEYVSFMWQHTGFLIRRRRIGWPVSVYMQVKSTAGAALNFMLLRRARRTYEFTIDDHGIVRTSDTGVSLIGWDDVTGLRSYARGLMMVLKRGTLPIPFRCLKGDEAETLRALVAAHKGGRQE